jgi:hypothetical protein
VSVQGRRVRSNPEAVAGEQRCRRNVLSDGTIEDWESAAGSEAVGGDEN